MPPGQGEATSPTVTEVGATRVTEIATRPAAAAFRTLPSIPSSGLRPPVRRMSDPKTLIGATALAVLAVMAAVVVQSKRNEGTAVVDTPAVSAAAGHAAAPARPTEPAPPEAQENAAEAETAPELDLKPIKPESSRARAPEPERPRTRREPKPRAEASPEAAAPEKAEPPPAPPPLVSPHKDRYQPMRDLLERIKRNPQDSEALVNELANQLVNAVGELPDSERARPIKRCAAGVAVMHDLPGIEHCLRQLTALSARGGE
jgi:hypothetical protein